jgi:ankyrin repeat protein
MKRKAQKFAMKNQRIEVQEGLRYSPWMIMEELIDSSKDNKECKTPSRCLLVKLLLENSADPNFISNFVKHTPLHWLAYHGDHRAIDEYLKRNNDDGILLARLKEKGRSKDWINKQGALNLFMTSKDSNELTPVDIAGDKNKLQSLTHMINYITSDE